MVRRLAIVLGLAMLGFVGGCGGNSGPPGGCKTGCPCGQSCISCKDVCHHEGDADGGR